MAKKSPSEELPELVYPVYLNVPMMTSFIAALENGVAFELDQTSTNKDSGEKTKSIESGFKIGEAFAGLLGIDLKGQLGNKTNVSEEVAVKAMFRHTEASLFIKFRQSLMASDLLLSLDCANDEQITNLQKGQLIEVSGLLGGDFIQDVIGLFEQFKPYVGLIQGVNTQDQAQGATRQERRKNNPTTKPISSATPMSKEFKEAQSLIETIKTDLGSSSVQDMLLVSNSQFKTNVIKVIIPLLKSHITDSSFESVKFSELTIIGKIIAVGINSDSPPANLLRRSALGLTSQTALESLFTSFKEIYTSSIPDAPQVNGSVVEQPWIELLPIALYV